MKIIVCGSPDGQPSQFCLEESQTFLQSAESRLQCLAAGCEADVNKLPVITYKSGKSSDVSATLFFISTVRLTNPVFKSDFILDKLMAVIVFGQ